jgi:beta-hydroxylase
MDKVGTAVNKLLFSLIKASPYVKQPLKNLANWHRRDKKA